MEKSYKKCCFTGHRPKSLPWGYNDKDIRCVSFKAKLKEILLKAIDKGYNFFISGMAEGLDTYALEVLLEIKDEHKKNKLPLDIIIEGAIPCLDQDKKWSASAQGKYKELLSKLDKKTIISESYTPTCMIDRNNYMISQTELVIACYSSGYGGTYSTIAKAKKQGKKLIIINPYTLEVSK